MQPIPNLSVSTFLFCQYFIETSMSWDKRKRYCCCCQLQCIVHFACFLFFLLICLSIYSVNASHSGNSASAQGHRVASFLTIPTRSTCWYLFWCLERKIYLNIIIHKWIKNFVSVCLSRFSGTLCCSCPSRKGFSRYWPRTKWVCAYFHYSPIVYACD